MKMLSVEEAKNQLATLLDDVERGEEIVITRNGLPVIEMKASTRPVPPTTAEREAAWRELNGLMEKGFPRPVGRFSREEIYEERMQELEERRNRHRE